MRVVLIWGVTSSNTPMSMNSLDERCVQVSVVSLLGTTAHHDKKCDVQSVGTYCEFKLRPFLTRLHVPVTSNLLH